MKAVFLDIDGVLQPYESENHFYSYDSYTKKIINNLSDKYKVDYAKYGIDDVLSVYYEWHKSAISRLKKILEETDSNIIISSDWRREELPDKMHDLLKIHDLDKYWLCDNIIIKKPIMIHEKRYLEIQDSLNRYPIDNYVVLDDMVELEPFFPNNSVITYDYISTLDMNEAIKILKKTR